MEKLLLIDGNSLINRAFYATPPLSSPDGTPTNAVYAFLNMLFKAISDMKPTNIVVAFDVKAPTFRHNMYADYKGTRKPMPEDLRPQIQLLKEVLSSMGILIIEPAGIEADDIIGTIAHKTDIETIIITGDKDSFQLIDDSTKVFFTKRGITDLDIYDNLNFFEKMGITPSQVIELKALMGDSSDNIPGIPGVGEKTAKDLLTKYANLEGIYANIDELKGKLKEKVEGGKDLAYLSRTLATINQNTDIPFSLEGSRLKFPLPLEAKETFNKLGFKTLVKKEELFVKGENIKVVTEVKIKELSSLEELKELKLNGKTFLYLDKELSFYNENYAEVEFLVKIKEGFLDDGVDYIDLLKSFNDIFKGELVVFDKKKMMHTLCPYAKLDEKVDDLLCLKYLVAFSGKEESFEEVLDFYGEADLYKGYAMSVIYKTLYDKLVKDGMLSLYEKVEKPLITVLYEMEKAGFKVDSEALNLLSEKYQKELTSLEEDIFALAGETFNINSPKQLGVILFEKLGLKTGKKTKSGYSTNAEVLESLENAHPIIPSILKYRKIQKLKSTYVDGFKPLITSEGLIHTSFNQFVTATGRLSSKEPNLQNIPIREEEGRELRKFFIPRSTDNLLVSADYSQIELRLLADFSNCTKLINAFNKDEDVHSVTASEVFGVKKEEVTSEMRRKAKAVNFGIIYGISDFGLSKNVKTSVKEAREYIERYFANYPEVKEYMDKNVAFAKENGFVATLLNRKRYIPEIKSPNFILRSFGERAAMNMPLQGSSADIIKVAMVNVHNRLIKEGLKSKLILQVHDELIIDALKEEVEAVTKLLTEEMENAVKLKVKLTAESKVGETWFEAK